MAGRPKIILDEEAVYNEAKYGSNIEDLAHHFGVSESFLYKNYYDVYLQGRAHGNSAIHKKQFEKGMEGDTSMLIHLGKQRLGQSEKMHQTNGVQEIEVIIRKPLASAPDGEIGDSRPASSADRLLGESSEA